LIGKIYSLFKFKEFSIIKDFIKFKFSFSWFIKLFKITNLSNSKKVENIKKKIINKKNIILFEKLNISLEAKEVT
jgi:hypothetical protein